MLARFIDHLRNVCGVKPHEKLLLACSGGIDSMSLAHLLIIADQPFSLAHCNFRLRGQDSDHDQAFVENWAKENGLMCHVKVFDTKKIKDESSGSTQMIARELRYAWFQELIAEHNYSWLVTAHHLDDSIETFFINILRSSGLAGLTGISAVSGMIIRPLSFATKDEIRQYARLQKISWREDKSNDTDHYLRNRIRQQFIPLLEKENAGFKNSFAHTLQYLEEAQKSLGCYFDMLKDQCLLSDNMYSLEMLRAIPHPGIFLHHLFSRYGFTGSQLKDLQAAFHSPETKRFESGNYALVVSRNILSLVEISSLPDSFSANNIEELAQLPFVKQVSTVKAPADINNPKHAYIDLDKLSFPVVFSHWEKGDKFQPFGMKGKKLVSDYFNDIKLDHAGKQRQLIMRSGDMIVWLVGRRLDDRFKIGEATNHILSIEIV